MRPATPARPCLPARPAPHVWTRGRARLGPTARGGDAGHAALYAGHCPLRTATVLCAGHCPLCRPLSSVYGPPPTGTGTSQRPRAELARHPGQTHHQKLLVGVSVLPRLPAGADCPFPWKTGYANTAGHCGRYKVTGDALPRGHGAPSAPACCSPTRRCTRSRAAAGRERLGRNAGLCRTQVPAREERNPESRQVSPAASSQPRRALAGLTWGATQLDNAQRATPSAARVQRRAAPWSGRARGWGCGRSASRRYHRQIRVNVAGRVAARWWAECGFGVCLHAAPGQLSDPLGGRSQEDHCPRGALSHSLRVLAEPKGRGWSWLLAFRLGGPYHWPRVLRPSGLD